MVNNGSRVKYSYDWSITNKQSGRDRMSSSSCLFLRTSPVGLLGLQIHTSPASPGKASVEKKGFTLCPCRRQASAYSLNVGISTADVCEDRKSTRLNSS